MVDKPEDDGKDRHFKVLLSKQSRNFSWEIENIEMWPLNMQQNTPYFYPEPNVKFYATLQIQKKYRSEELECRLSFTFSEGKIMSINHTALVTNRVGQVLHKFDPKNFKYEYEGSLCELDPCPLAKLLNNSEDSVLIFKWTMEYVRFTTSLKEHTKKEQEHNVVCEQTTEATSTQASVNVLNLSNQLKEMYIEAQNTDITLKIDNIDVPVHKCILSKRSPVFAKMFESNMIEYHIPDLKLSVLKALVEFLYSATLHSDDFESVHDLYHAADLFKVDDLKTTCISILLSKLDVGNACRALVLAHDHQDIDFKKSVMDFILSRFTEIVKTTAFKQFVEEYTGLAAEVMKSHIW